MSRFRMTHAELMEAGQLVAASEMFGKINPASGYMIASICDQKGISYLEFSETYNWMHGAPTMKADAMLAKFCEMGGRYKMIDRTPEKASIEVEYDGQKHTFSITWDEVKDEPFTQKYGGGVKSNYATPRKRMQSLSSRAVSDAVHTICPQACKGIYTTEEADTFINDDEPPRRAERPATITKEDVACRVKNHAEPDATICPEGFGEYSGKPWVEMSDDVLAAAAQADGLSHAHRAAIRLVMEERATGEQA